MSSELRRLPDGELEVMQALWDCEPPATRADVEKAMGEKHPMAVTTLLTLLTRLGEKGFVKVEKLGRGNGYTPLVSSRTIWPPRAAGSWISCAVGASPPLPPRCAAAD